MSWEIERKSPGVHRVTFSGSNYPELNVMLSADWHWDNPKARWDLIERDLRTAKKIGAMVCCFGDGLCLMQGKYDKRSNKDSLRPEHATGSYLDKVVDTFVEFLAPYRDVMGLISLGNHETAIQNRHETCVITRVVERLRLLGSPCKAGGYNGWLQLTGKSKSGGSTYNYNVYYHHGSGGDAVKTMGLLGMDRINSFVAADAIVSGHIHARNLTNVARETITGTGKRVVKEIALVRCSTYKDEYQPLTGFHIEKGRGPRPVENPAYWLRLKMKPDKSGLNVSYADAPPQGLEEIETGTSRNDDNKRRSTNAKTSKPKTTVRSTKARSRKSNSKRTAGGPRRKRS